MTRLKYKISYNEQRARCCVKIDLSHEEKLKEGYVQVVALGPSFLILYYGLMIWCCFEMIQENDSFVWWIDLPPIL